MTTGETSTAAEGQVDTWAYVGLGANLGDPLAQLREAARLLEAVGGVEARSSIYATEPVGGPAGQPEYLNAVIAVRPRTHDPVVLLDELLAVERSLGRSRAERWGPRLIDLDLLAFGDVVLATEEGAADGDGSDAPYAAAAEATGRLTLPHPRLADRAFVLVPFCEVAAMTSAERPAWRHPVTGLTPCEMLAALGPTTGVRQTDLRW